MRDRPDEEFRRRTLEELLDTHGPQLYGTLVRLTLRRTVATELFQELFSRLGRSSGFGRADSPPAYAFRAAINLAMEWRRKDMRRVRAGRDGEPAAERVSGDRSPLERLIESETHERLLDAISKLSQRVRQVVVLRFVQQKSYGDIAMEIGKTPNQARAMCHGGLRKLRQRFAGVNSRSALGRIGRDHVEAR